METLRRRPETADSRRLFRLLTWLLTLFSMLCSASMWRLLRGWPLPSSAVRAGCLLAAGMMAMYSLRYIRRQLRYVVLLTGYLFAYVLFRRHNAEGYLLTVAASFAVFLLLALSALRSGRLGIVFAGFAEVVTALAAVSLVCWLLGSVLRILPGRSSVIFRMAGRYFRGYTYGFLYFENPRQYTYVFGSRLARNTGVFAEVPSFASYLVYAFVIELFQNRGGLRRRVILALALMTTVSAKGYVFLLELWLLWYLLLKEPRDSLEKRRHTVGAVAVIALAVAAAGYVLAVKSRDFSFAYRVDSALAGLRTWRKHPLFGSGYGNAEEIIANVSLTRNAQNTSMGLTTLLGHGGLYLTAFYLLPYVGCARRLRRPGWRKAFIFLAVISLTDLAISRIIYSVYYEMIVAVGYAVWMTGHGPPRRREEERHEKKRR